jgi:hypothetical protein
VLQSDHPSAKLLLLGEGWVREVIDDAIGMFGLHLRLFLLLDRHPEHWLVGGGLQVVLASVLSLVYWQIPRQRYRNPGRTISLYPPHDSGQTHTTPNDVVTNFAIW